jgi:YidC/Oxa1 family membrane protein insertase
MSTEIRFLVAVVLMIGVLVITNLLFPPVPPEEMPGYVPPDSVVATEGDDRPAQTLPEMDSVRPEEPAAGDQGDQEPADPLSGLAEDPGSTLPQATESSGTTVSVETQLYSLTFSTTGARLTSAELPGFPSFTREGPVQLVHSEGGAALGSRILVGTDTVSLEGITFEAEPQGGLDLREGGGEGTLRFSYRHPTEPFSYEVAYTFRPDRYLISAEVRITGLDAQWIFTDLGFGIPFNEQKERDEARAAAYVLKHPQEGIRSQMLSRVEEPTIEEGPLTWAVLKSKYFMVALLPGPSPDDELHLGGLVANPTGSEFQVSMAASQPVSRDGIVQFRLFLGPQDYARLEAIGEDLENANPYGWKFMRPLIRPFSGIIIRILTFLHQNLNIGYGWVLILFGIMMRVVLFPLNQKGMKAQMRNMAAQPLMQEIQTKYKDNPEKLQKEMMKLYKEHGFNPLAGCLPMLLPWPVLIALFFVFQNTIELRGVSFLWLPDLSAPDPLFILPAFLGISMFLLQWVSMRSMPQQNPQMKMMMYVMPIMMVFIFFQLASGLNLYYATANIATLPQQIYIAKERKKVQDKPPLKLKT